ncbi:MAG: 4-hydroxy-tetrahydrodipicolinate reductase [Candidatus Sericytochromatia bacterium]|nr:4-hydroxy-tetrahydrodipicolinate reductase [Candidatus Sericytochromatia bacterium]
MGKEAVRAIAQAQDLTLVGCLTGRHHQGDDAGVIAGIGPIGVPLQTDLAAVLAETRPDVFVDLTVPAVIERHLDITAAAGIHTVVGTTGLPESRFGAWDAAFRQQASAALICPNFALGAMLMIEFAKQAAKYFPDAAIVEWHHAAKVDAPSGTALRTAMAIGQADAGATGPEAPSLGERVHGIPVHSIRLPGLLAHQEVIFGGPGQVLTIRHDAMSRECYMPGLLLAIRNVGRLQGFVVGLEHVLALTTGSNP